VLVLDRVSIDGAPVDAGSANRHLNGAPDGAVPTAGTRYALYCQTFRVVDIRGCRFTNLPNTTLEFLDGSTEYAQIRIAGNRFEAALNAIVKPQGIYEIANNEFEDCGATALTLNTANAWGVRKGWVHDNRFVDSGVLIGDGGYGTGANLLVEDNYASYGVDNTGAFRTTLTGGAAGFLLAELRFRRNTIELTGGRTVAIGGAVTTALLEENVTTGTMVGVAARGVTEPAASGTNSFDPTVSGLTLLNAGASGNVQYVLPAGKPVGFEVRLYRAHATHTLMLSLTGETVEGGASVRIDSQYGGATVQKTGATTWGVVTRAGTVTII
jgi:hypothetical protein